MKKIFLFAAALALFPAITFAASTPLLTTAKADSSAVIQKDIAGLSPQVAGILAPLFTFIDGLRYNAVGTLDAQIQFAQIKINANPAPSIAGGSTTQDATIQNGESGAWYWVYTIYYYLLLIAEWLVATAIAFYPVLLFLILYILFRLFRYWRRPY